MRDLKKYNMAVEKRIFHLICLLLIILISACSKVAEQDPILVKAFQVHENSLSLAKDVEKMLNEISVQDSVIMHLDQRFNSWEESVIEVPGFEHEHHHDHEHYHHDHAPKINLTSQQIYEIQIELQDSIIAIKEALSLYKENSGN